MPRGAFYTYPLDEPVILRDGVTHREADFHGSAHWLYVSPEHPERAAKGDLGMAHIKNFEPRYSFESQGRLPYKNLRKGK